MVEHPADPIRQPVRRYVYVWEFRVSQGRESEFLAAYGPSGTWSALFRKTAGYVETLLLQDQIIPGRFITIDRWSSQSAHDAFLARFRAEYEALDLLCASLTTSESSLGSYWEFVNAAV